MGSVITDLKLLPTLRKEQNYQANCLNCNACISRCPVGAITTSGHDKIKCRTYLFSEESVQLAEKYGGKKTAGCGLCQTRVPCEFKNPRRKTETRYIYALKKLHLAYESARNGIQGIGCCHQPNTQFLTIAI
jgi:epoxyqueuosine reductase QueG